MKTTLNKIREHSPCVGGWEKLLRTLGKTTADDDELRILQILDSNGLNDALWCLRAVDGYDREIKLFAVWCARQVEHLMEGSRSKNALILVEKFVNGDATDGELNAARAVWDVARAAACAVACTVACAAARAAQEKELRRILNKLGATNGN